MRFGTAPDGREFLDRELIVNCRFQRLPQAARGYGVRESLWAEVAVGAGGDGFGGLG